ncbi:hypothetical protein SCLCIDRAFT_116178 [Scleroderma citrinum Foug A]|uniref:Glycosyltransferase 61 catalytic domain-containing protein n=1 Tax=Scleroderma citrinum Foug A TaxID=1036808 RepID=A0A0C3E6G8_9AGAM|nr:hypothetical protein SCLCIDRAFT_116178 [Scleroderma citrinum Foug A]
MLRNISSVPTKREVLLLAIIFTFFVWAFSGDQRPLSIGLITAFLPKQDLFNEEIPVEDWRTRLSWSSESDVPPQTNIVLHAPGWTVFDNLYVANGTVFVVTNQPETVPPREMLISTGIELRNDAESVAARLPTNHEMRIISIEEARELFGDGATLVDGVTWMMNDPPQLIRHYYHWVAEIFFGFWRTYSSLDPSISASGISSLPAPRRIWFVHLDADQWRDKVHFNEWVLRSVFPSLTAEYSNDWIDRAGLGRPFLLDRVLISDRAAAMRGKNYHETSRPSSEAFSLPESSHWWVPITTSVMEFAGLDEASIVATSTPPVITYVSRQTARGRMLMTEHHNRLIEELYELRDKYAYEVNVVSMEKLSREEQIGLAARTTIMMGVHGNGLTSLLWMKRSPRTTVMEFFYPGGFTRDYQNTAYSLGISYYGWWGNVSFTSENLPRRDYPDGFQGNEIPIDGKAVAETCLEILQAQDQ